MNCCYSTVDARQYSIKRLYLQTFDMVAENNETHITLSKNRTLNSSIPIATAIDGFDYVSFTMQKTPTHTPNYVQSEWFLVHVDWRAFAFISRLTHSCSLSYRYTVHTAIGIAAIGITAIGNCFRQILLATAIVIKLFEPQD